MLVWYFLSPLLSGGCHNQIGTEGTSGSDGSQWQEHRGDFVLFGWILWMDVTILDVLYFNEIYRNDTVVCRIHITYLLYE